MILNRAAGTANGENAAADEEICRLFSEAGVVAEIRHPTEERSLSAIAGEAREGADEVVVAGGGDGTVGGVAAALAGSGKILGVLPMGTLNHFAKDLGIPLDLPGAVAAIVNGETAGVDVGEVNGRVFINNSSLGIYPRIVAQRETQQEGLGMGKWPAFVWAMIQALRRFPFLRLRITFEGRQLDRKTAFLFVGNNEYEISGFRLGGRACLNAGKLGLYLTHRTGRFGLFRLAFHALLGRLKQVEDFDAFCVKEALIETQRARLLVATDGEVNWFKTPLQYRVRPGALRVRVPRPKNAG